MYTEGVVLVCWYAALVIRENPLKRGWRQGDRDLQLKQTGDVGNRILTSMWTLHMLWCTVQYYKVFKSNYSIIQYISYAWCVIGIKYLLSYCHCLSLFGCLPEWDNSSPNRLSSGAVNQEVLQYYCILYYWHTLNHHTATPWPEVGQAAADGWIRFLAAWSAWKESLAISGALEMSLLMHAGWCCCSWHARDMCHNQQRRRCRPDSNNY